MNAGVIYGATITFSVTRATNIDVLCQKAARLLRSGPLLLQTLAKRLMADHVIAPIYINDGSNRNSSYSRHRYVAGPKHRLRVHNNQGTDSPC